MEYNEALEYIYSRQRFGIKLGLENIKILLHSLGEPQHSYPAVLIAGTNGKGSTAAIMASILCQAGYRVGLYTSPHLVKLEERIQVNNKCILEGELTKLTEELKNLINNLLQHKKLRHQPTFFEVTTALGLEYFRRQQVDIALLEVGMGGRLDATNSVEPILSIITNIGLDHSQQLGSSLPEIALEKAGIIRDFGQVVISPSSEEALKTIIEQCRKRKASFILSHKGISDICLDGDFRYQFNLLTPAGNYIGLRAGLRGIHQVENAATAVRSVELLQQHGFTISRESIRKGLEQARWPGRLELINHCPQVWLDGAHNVGAARCLRNFILQNLPRRITLIFSALKDKDIEGMSQILFPLAKLVIITKLHSERAEEPEKIASLAPANSPFLLLVDSAEEALQVARRKASPKDIIIATGSLYLVGELKKFSSLK